VDRRQGAGLHYRHEFQLSPPPAAGGVGQSTQADNSPESIQQRIDALLIAWRYAGSEQKTNIQQRIDALQIAITYATYAKQ